MAKLNVNPTRSELKALKARLKTAVRGHKLLKDKSDEMVRRFMVFIRENKRLREELTEELSGSLRSFMLSSALMTPQAIEQAVALPAFSAEIEPKIGNIMGLKVPRLTVKSVSNAQLYPYSFVSTTSELDNSIDNLSGLLTKIIKLAEIEKICNMLADEIEKNRRRVNALEYVMIPQINETIKYIAMKLDENERSGLIRLMKVKAMIEEKNQK